MGTDCAKKRWRQQIKAQQSLAVLWQFKHLSPEQALLSISLSICDLLLQLPCFLYSQSLRLPLTNFMSSLPAGYAHKRHRHNQYTLLLFCRHHKCMNGLCTFKVNKNVATIAMVIDGYLYRSYSPVRVNKALFTRAAKALSCIKNVNIITYLIHYAFLSSRHCLSVDIANLS